MYELSRDSQRRQRFGRLENIIAEVLSVFVTLDLVAVGAGTLRKNIIHQPFDVEL